MAQTTQTKDPSFSPDWRFQDPIAWRDTDLDENILTEWFHYMLLGRQIDYRFQVLNRQGRAPFIISCAGHEAADRGQLAAQAQARLARPLLPRRGAVHADGHDAAGPDALGPGQGR